MSESSAQSATESPSETRDLNQELPRRRVVSPKSIPRSNLSYGIVESVRTSYSGSLVYVTRSSGITPTGKARKRGRLTWTESFERQEIERLARALKAGPMTEVT
jgi:hypothetical protein